VTACMASYTPRYRAELSAGPGVQIAPRGGDRSMAERLLHKMNGRAPVEASFARRLRTRAL
jgi:hypothetical protein